MKQIQKDELYENLSQFLKGKGVDLKEGPYTKGIHAGCSMLADAINLSQAGFDRARTEIERKVDQVRQVIHEKTAPKAPPVASTVTVKANGPTARAGSSTSNRSRNRKGRDSTRKKPSRRGR